MYKDEIIIRRATASYLPLEIFYQKEVVTAASLKRLFSFKSRFNPQYSLLTTVEKQLTLWAMRVLSLPYLLKRTYRYPQSDPYWQSLLNYLHKEGVVTDPKLRVDIIPNDEPKFIGVSIQAELGPRITDGYRGTKKGWLGHGISFEYHEAVSKALGELLERYFSGIYRNGRLLEASLNQLKKERRLFVPFSKFEGFSQKQLNAIPQLQYSADSLFRWVEVEDLLKKTVVLLPAQLVFWNYRLKEGEAILRLANTNGAAGGFTEEEAILAGMYEIIQRDSFLLFWLNKIAPPRIDPSLLGDEEIRKIVSALKRYNLEGYILDTTSDLDIFSCAFVIIDRSNSKVAVTIGGGCGMDKIECIKGAYAEALTVRHWLVWEGVRFTVPKGYRQFIDPVSHEDRMRLWMNTDMLSHIDWFVAGPVIAVEQSRSIPLLYKNKREELLALKKRLSEKISDFSLYVYTAKSQVLKKVGFHVVKVIIPELIPLYLVERYGPIAMNRIKEGIKKMGYVPPEEVNHIPHPFP